MKPAPLTSAQLLAAGYNSGDPEGLIEFAQGVSDARDAQWEQMLAGQEPVRLRPMAKRRIFDAIRSAYDLGYNDARNARSVPGDGALGYKGRRVEADHGGALFFALERYADAQPKAEPSSAEKELRRMLCVAYAGSSAYMDDGEAQDNRDLPCIDFLRDSPTEIRDKMQRRALKALAVQPKAEPSKWYEGAPPFPQDQEWFIAETTFGDRVVLRSLDEGRLHQGNYAFKTADETYMKAETVKRWMQFPDCEYLPPDAQPKAEPAGDFEALSKVLGYVEQAAECNEYIERREYSEPHMMATTVAGYLRKAVDLLTIEFAKAGFSKTLRPAQPKPEPVNQMLLEALKAGTSIEHDLPLGEICKCSQCEFVRLRRAAIAAAEGEQK